MYDPAMKKILITGASRGIGAAISQSLLAQGHAVLGLARQAESLAEFEHYTPWHIDLAANESLEANFKELVNQHPHVDAIILAAGFGHFAMLEQFSAAKAQTLLQVNFMAQALLVKAYLPALKQQQHGKIIAIGSESALQGARQGSFYCASKFALRGFMQSLRQECSRDNIAVTMINPGFVDTEFFAQLSFQPGDDRNHKIQAQQIADAVQMVMAMENNCVVEELNLQPLQKVVQRKRL